MESGGSSDQEDEQIVQVREALMCLNGKNFEGLRTARFLKYTTTSIDDEVFDLPLDAFACRPEAIDPEKWMAKILFPGWGSPSVNWVEWVNAMAESHATVWRKSGVHDAILASRYQIKKKDDLMMALVEKWCIETNTFVFAWGEATVTLEDMIVLGGFSVIGNNAMAPSKREDVKKVEDKMKKVKCEIEADSGKKCCVSSWMKEMMKSGSEIEHEAFMVSWLSRFVFPNSADLLKDMLFPAAIQLAKGVKLALAPAVLAGIYRDLGVLKEYLAGYSEKETVVVKSPLQFVQVWAYERIMELQPPGQPSQLDPGEPRMARWHQHGGGQDPYGYPENVRAVLESVKESFDFRPYTKPLNNFKFPRFYLEDKSWVHVHSDDKNILAFARCLRFSKLVGLDCIEPYYPHRVALQFGYDQDVPGIVPARTKTPELAWKDYIRPISGDMLYIPTRLHEGDVTVGYIRWWKLSIAILQSEAKKISHKQKPATIVVDAITTKGTSFPPGEKAEEKGQELVKKKKKSKTNKVTCITGSENKVEGRSHVRVSEQAIKHSLKKLEWVKRSPPLSTKSTEISSSSAPDLKGVLRGSGGTKGHGHVTFQLPGSSLRKSPSNKNMLLAKQSDSPIKKTRMLPRVADIAKQSSSSSRVPGHTSFVPLPDKRDKYIKNISSSSPPVLKYPYKSPSFSGYPSKRNKPPRSLEIVNSLSLQGSKESCKSPSVSGSSSLTRNKLPRSLEVVNSSGNNNYTSPRVSKLNKSASSFDSISLSRKKSARSFKNVHSSSRDNSVAKRNTDTSTIASKQETPRKARELDISKATNVKFLEEIATLREHVGEGGEVTYHIPKQQFEDLSQGVQDVLHDLHSIKYALNIHDDDDE